MTVTGLKRKGRKVQVSFDDGNSVVLNYEIFMKNGLKMNSELSENRFLFLKDENLKYDIKQSALRIIARRLHSTSELRTKLLQKYHRSDFVDDTIEYLTYNQYLDDEKFMQGFIEEKSRSKLWGSRKIRIELRKRGITDIALSETKLEGQLADNQDNILKAAERKMKNLTGRGTSADKIKPKLISYLLSRGFEYDDIKSAVEKILNNSKSGE